MASLKKLDVLIRGNSNITIDDAVKWTSNWANKRQENDNNKDKDGNYINEFFVELFDSRDSSTYKIFCDYSTEKRKIENKYICEDGTEIKGVITVFVKKDLIEEIKKSLNSNKTNYEVRKINITKNPYTIEEDGIIFMSANSNDDAAEVRTLDNIITVYDADGFSDENILYEISEDKPLKLEILIIKG